MFVVIVVTLALLNGAHGTTVMRCSNGVDMPSEVRIKGCDKPPCKLVRGSDVILDVEFKPPADTKTLSPRVKATTSGITIDYTLPEDQKDACKHLTEGSCPLAAGEQTTYHLVMPVAKIYPKISVDLIYSLVDDSQKDVTCFQVPCVVVDQ